MLFSWFGSCSLPCKCTWTKSSTLATLELGSWRMTISHVSQMCSGETKLLRTKTDLKCMFSINFLQWFLPWDHSEWHRHPASTHRMGSMYTSLRTYLLHSICWAHTYRMPLGVHVHSHESIHGLLATSFYMLGPHFLSLGVHVHSHASVHGLLATSFYMLGPHI